MTRLTVRHHLRLGLRTAGVLLLAAALALPALAQRLPAYLPADTVLALGAVDLEAHAELFESVLADWERFGAGPALERALAGADAGMLGVPLDLDGADDVALPEVFADLEAFDLLGREAWLAVSLSPFNPLPSVTLLALVDEATGARFDAALADATGMAGAQTLREGDASFVAVLLDGVPTAGARYGELLAVSTNPDTLRAVLRAAQGGSDPSFAGSAGYVATIGSMGPGQLYGFLDLEPLARALTPLASGLGFDRSVSRLAAMLETFGTSAGVVRVTPTGSETESVQLLRADGRDPALFALLAGGGGGVPARLLDVIPAEAVSVSATSGHPAAIYDYLITLLRELPELALPDPEGLIRDLVGVDLRRDVFAWMADGSLTITTGFGAAVDPGVPSDDLLGETALVFLSDDDAAASAGLERTGTMLASLVSAFADPMGAGGMVQPVRRDVAGVTVTSFAVFPGVDLHVAAANGYALVATSAGAADAAARAIAAGGAPSATIARLLPEVPAGAASFTVSDDRATLLGTAEQL
ncbi:MAG: hypothetical protein JK586_18425, partial [Nocardiopsis sp. BM-2018]